jgi:hypothetical protein
VPNVEIHVEVCFKNYTLSFPCGYIVSSFHIFIGKSPRASVNKFIVQIINMGNRYGLHQVSAKLACC